MKKTIFIAFMLVAAQIFSGCGDEKVENKSVQKVEKENFDLSNAKDGIYTVESSRDEKLGKSVLTLTIQDKKIIDAEFKGYDMLGNEKDETYGEILGKDSADYKKAQVAAKAIQTYPKQLVETQDLNQVDAISGATVSHGQFVETTKKAVAESKK